MIYKIDLPSRNKKFNHHGGLGSESIILWKPVFLDGYWSDRVSVFSKCSPQKGTPRHFLWKVRRHSLCLVGKGHMVSISRMEGRLWLISHSWWGLTWVFFNWENMVSKILLTWKVAWYCLGPSWYLLIVSTAGETVIASCKVLTSLDCLQFCSCVFGFLK